MQLTGIGCLRAAVRWMAQLRGQSLADHRDRLDPRRLAAQVVRPGEPCTPDQIVAETSEVMRLVPADLRFSPDAKSFVRAYWQLLSAAAEVQEDELFIVDVAGCVRVACVPAGSPLLDRPGIDLATLIPC